MKTNLVKLELAIGETMYGKFLGSIDTEYFTGTDMRPEIVDFFLGIDGLYYAHDHKGINVTNVSDRFVSCLRNTGFPLKKRGRHCNSNNKCRYREQEFEKEMNEIFAYIDDLYDDDNLYFFPV